jgi:hypothetical protein
MVSAGKKRKFQSPCEKSELSTTLDVGVVDGFTPDEDHACQLHVGERLGKLEQLFEKFVCRKAPNSVPNISSSQDSSRTAVSARSDEKPFKFTGLPLLQSSDGQSLAEGIVSVPCQYIYPHRTNLVSARNTYLVVGAYCQNSNRERRCSNVIRPCPPGIGSFTSVTT